jgi:arylsulfatase A-like enzyme
MAAYRNVQRALRTDTHKLIEYNVNGQRTTQLFDVRRDPWEMRNLAQEQPGRVGTLRAALRYWMRRADDPALAAYFSAGSRTSNSSWGPGKSAGT